MTAYVNKYKRVTKLLLRIATIFDPLLERIIAKTKIIMQRLWELKVEWDEVVSMDIITLWNIEHNLICY